MLEGWLSGEIAGSPNLAAGSVLWLGGETLSREGHDLKQIYTGTNTSGK